MPSYEPLNHYFYGTHDHYQHPGWYFDLIVNDLDNLEEESALLIRPGRFVLVKSANAIFMRTGNENQNRYYFMEIPEGSNVYYDPKDLNGKEYTQEEEGYITTEGFRFIAFTNNMAQVLLENGNIYIPYDVETQNYKLYTASDQIAGLASYYFGL